MPRSSAEAEATLLVIIAVVAALGSFATVATSFATSIGNGAYDGATIARLTLRIPVAVLSAALVALTVRAGLAAPPLEIRRGSAAQNQPFRRK